MADADVKASQRKSDENRMEPCKKNKKTGKEDAWGGRRHARREAVSNSVRERCDKKRREKKREEKVKYTT